ncbi:helix-turn-helix transcriptional regulator [Streptomyces sp. SBST2-5]|uniref:Helix-turn-helix transcriptional regulator n=1 Tax=Streptomyces composti TaxID=2720025 RepID=A0ABX1A623_9ACTN|nr:helix-turn-helix transcriptional regulator [Streptomyces composti]NJP50111.1 helix-turn-helix transcriptional regulator [Streptomyces composti]
MPDHVRAAVLEDVAITYRTALDADENSKVRIHLALEQGVTTRELEEELGVPQQTISRWGRQGKEALERRREARAKRESGGQPTGEDPVRPGEPGPVG